MIMLPLQCRMARCRLGQGIRELAEPLGIGVATVRLGLRGEALKARHATKWYLGRHLRWPALSLPMGISLASGSSGPPQRVQRRSQLSAREQFAAKPPELSKRNGRYSSGG